MEEGRQPQVPYFIRLKDEKYFALAGLWDHWKDPKGEEIKSFTIITTKANDVLGEIHPRIPVILNKEDEGLWLCDRVLTDKDFERLFRPFPSELMVYYPVSSSVKSVKNDTEGLIAPA